MKKLLITGVLGFVGKHLLNYLASEHDLSILGIDIANFLTEAGKDCNQFTYEQVDMLDGGALMNMIGKFKPDIIIHLASSSSVAYSWINPRDSFRNNTNIFLNLVEAIRNSQLDCRLLSVGSSEEYGIVDKNAIPLREDYHVKPINPYAVARLSQEMLSEVYVNGYGMDIVLTRSFNHIGPGQDNRFFIPNVASQLCKIKQEYGRNDNIGNLFLGDLSVVRDYVDVRDVVKAYWTLAQRGRTGELYNVCSGNGYCLREIAHMMMEITGIFPGIQIDSSRLRPTDNPIIIGSNKKIFEETSWMPVISLEESLHDVISFSAL